MAKKPLPYNPDDSLSIDVLFWCDVHQQRRPFLACAQCEQYPCSQLSRQDQRMLEDSPLMEKTVIGLTERKIKTMYIAKFRDGRLEAVDIDPSNPDVELVSQIEEVYVVSKTLVPTVTLKPKPKEERARVRAQAKAAEASAAEPPGKPARTRKK